MADLSARIKPKKSSTASEVPQAADLEVAELAVNTADGKLFTKHTDGSIVTISGGSTALNDLSDVSYSGGSLNIDGLSTIFFVQDAPAGDTWAVYDNSIYGMTVGAYETATSDGSFVFVHPTKGVDIKVEETAVFNISGPTGSTTNTPEIRLNTGNPTFSTPTGNYFGLTLPAGYNTDQTYTVPAVDGTNGQALTTDGAGALSWTSSTLAGLADTEDAAEYPVNFTSFDAPHPTFTDPDASATGGSIDTTLGTNAWKVIATDYYGDGSKLDNFLATDGRYDVVNMRIRSTQAMDTNNRVSLGGNKQQIAAGGGFTIYTRDTGFGIYFDNSFQEVGTKPTMNANTWYEITWVADWGSAQRATKPAISLWVDGAIAIDNATSTATYTELTGAEANNFRLAWNATVQSNSGDKFWDDIRVYTTDTLPWSMSDPVLQGPIDAMEAVYAQADGLEDGQALTWNRYNDRWEPSTLTETDILPVLPTVTGTVIDSDATAATTQVLTAPTHNEGDLLVAVIMNRASGGTLTPPSGWTLYGSYLSSISFSGTSQDLQVFTKTATGSEPASYTWTQVSSSRICGLIAAVEGGATIEGVTESYGNGTAAQIQTVANRLNLTAATWIYAATGNETYSQKGLGVTEITDSPNTTARISGGYTTADTTVVSQHSATDTADDPNHGIINIAIRFATSISDVDDVDTVTTPPTDGQLLTWVDANDQWEAGSLQGAAVRTALGIGEYVDDAAAGTGGVASGALYYNTTSSDYRLKS